MSSRACSQFSAASRRCLARCGRRCRDAMTALKFSRRPVRADCLAQVRGKSPAVTRCGEPHIPSRAQRDLDTCPRAQQRPGSHRASARPERAHRLARGGTRPPPRHAMRHRAFRRRKGQGCPLAWSWNRIADSIRRAVECSPGIGAADGIRGDLRVPQILAGFQRRQFLGHLDRRQPAQCRQRFRRVASRGVPEQGFDRIKIPSRSSQGLHTLPGALVVKGFELRNERVTCIGCIPQQLLAVQAGLSQQLPRANQCFQP